jgi:hypothetical protein
MPEITIPIYADGDQERLGELRRAVDHARRLALADAGATRRVGDEFPEDAVAKAQAAYDAFVDEAAERAEGWHLHSIGFEEYRNLVKAHPARKVTEQLPDGTVEEKTHPEDDEFGINTESFPKELLLFADPEDDDLRTVVELKVGRENIAKNPEKLRRRVKRLSAGQFYALWTNAMVLNQIGVSDPKFDRFSPTTPRSSET